MDTFITTIKNCAFSDRRPSNILIGDFTEEEHNIILSLREPIKFICVEKGSIYYTFSGFNVQTLGNMLIFKLRRNTFVLSSLQTPYMFREHNGGLIENNVLHATNFLNNFELLHLVDDE
jgi:hypothetical protein